MKREVVIKLRVVTIVLVFFLNSFFSSAKASSFGLKDVVTQALSQRIEIQNSQLRLDISQRTADNVWNSLLPQADFISSLGQQKSYPNLASSLPETTSDIGIRLSETLYDHGDTKRKAKQEQVNLNISQIQLERERDRVAAEAARAYLSYCLSFAQTKVAEERLQLIEKQMRLVSNLFQQGLRPQKDLSRFAGRVKTTQLEVQQARNALAKALLDLRHKAGEIEGEFSLMEPPQKKAFLQLSQKIKGLNPIKDENLLEIKILKLQAQLSELQIEDFHAKNGPEIKLQTQGGYEGRNFVGTGDTFSEVSGFKWSAQLRVSYNLWDFGTRGSEIVNAKTKALIAHNEITKRSRELSLEMTKLKRQLEADLEALRVGEELQALAEKNFQHLEQENKEGKVDYLEMIDVINDLLAAKNNVCMSYFGIYDGLIQYYGLQGNVYGRLVAE